MGRRKIKICNPHECGGFQIELTKGAFAIVDADLVDSFTLWSWFLSTSGYAARTIRIGGEKRMVRMHREVLSLREVDIPIDAVVDHINGNKLDNRASNLRVASRILNSHNVSSFSGIEQRGSRFIARAMVRGTRMKIGSFLTRGEAEAAYLGFKKAVLFYEDEGIKKAPVAA